MDDYKFLTKLSQNLLEILDDDEYCDINIEVGNDPYAKTFRAHMVILNYRSPYLQRILSTNNKKNDGTLTHIKLPNISPEIFHVILRYIYGGNLSLEDYDTLDIIKILVAASVLCLQELITYLQYLLIKNKANWMEQNFNVVYQTSFENDSFLVLQKYCTDLMSKEPDKIFKSLNFSSIPEKLLITLIQSDSLQMSEVQVWEYVLKWGFAQNPELLSDPTNFSKNDFDALKNTLKQCIPFIRFYNLTSKEFSNKVLPYRKILPKELYMDLLETFLNLNPDSKPSDKSKPRITKSTSQTYVSLDENNNSCVQSSSQTHVSPDENDKNCARLLISERTAELSSQTYRSYHQNPNGQNGQNFNMAGNGEPSKTIVFVANLPFSIDDEDLKDVFKDYNVSSVHVVRNRRGRSMGFGFVELTDEGEQKKALEGLKDVELEGRVLTIEAKLH